MYSFSFIMFFCLFGWEYVVYLDLKNPNSPPHNTIIILNHLLSTKNH